MTIETKQLHALSKIYKEAVYGGGKKEAPKDTRMVVTNADKKANTKAYQNMKAGVKGYKAADHLKSEGYQRDPEQQEKERKTSKQTDPSKDNFTGIGNSIKDIMKQNAAMKKAAAKKTKTEDAKWGYDKEGNSLNPKDKKKKKVKEGFVNWRHDLKEIPDYEQIPVDSKKSNEKISEKKVKNTVKINPTMEEETQVDESYETKKTGEVLSAFKRDPKVRKRFEKAAKKEGGPGSAKNRAADDMLQTAKDTAKRKGDTSKSDDRYAYESKLWDEVAENLTELGELGGVKYKVVPLDESDIADILARLEKKRISKGGNPDESPLGKKTGRAMKSQQDKARKKAGVE